MLPLLDLTLPTIEENLALDEALLLQAESNQGGEHLRFWEWPEYAVILGAGGEYEKEAQIDRCQRDQIPILRRSSGGGTVLLGRGCLMFSLILSYHRDPELKFVNSSYRYILNRFCETLAFLGNIQLQGICDLTFNGLKFSGNAQQRKQQYLLHHGTLLYQFALEKVSTYLKQPDRQPDYRQNREHQQFITNLPIDPETLKNKIATIWEAKKLTTALPAEQIQQLMREKYTHAEWNLRR